jgi:hypothetical protein
MPGKTLAQKLFIRENDTVLLVNPPEGYLDLLGQLPEGAKIVSKATQPVEFIQVFAAKKSEMTETLRKVKPLLKEQGLLWATYPKTGQLETDLKREVVWECAEAVGMHAVAVAAVDSVWSALRLKSD